MYYLIQNRLKILTLYDIIYWIVRSYREGEIKIKKSWEQTSMSFKAMVTGKMLGDGSITKQNGRKPRFQFTHMHTDYYWSKYCYDCLDGIIPLNPPKFKKTIDPRLVEGYSLSYYVQSRTSDIITFLRSQWYPKKIKILPFELIDDYFNEQSLAWWYMDDGHLKQRNNTPEKIVISTDSFTIRENKWLIDFLYRRYDLRFRLDKQNRIILYDQLQIHYFLYLVTPFLHASMYRKIIPIYNIEHDIPPRRTTIYLPSVIKINSPTKEINYALNYLHTIIDKFKSDNFYKKYYKKVHNIKSGKTKGYQIIINKENISRLHLLNELTGLTYSQLAELSFDCLEQLDNYLNR